mmetsp:Transcript_8763/g.12540  ORF Transcript_8763/g.12540 Transcript_8763/m.12540 type:complete len:779 (-) Transcript_8763:565-2901(-)
MEKDDSKQTNEFQFDNNDKDAVVSCTSKMMENPRRNDGKIVVIDKGKQHKEQRKRTASPPSPPPHPDDNANDNNDASSVEEDGESQHSSLSSLHSYDGMATPPPSATTTATNMTMMTASASGTSMIDHDDDDDDNDDDNTYIDDDVPPVPPAPPSTPASDCRAYSYYSHSDPNHQHHQQQIHQPPPLPLQPQQSCQDFQDMATPLPTQRHVSNVPSAAAKTTASQPQHQQPQHHRHPQSTTGKTSAATSQAAPNKPPTATQNTATDEFEDWKVGPKYELIRILGRGSYGEVAQARVVFSSSSSSTTTTPTSSAFVAIKRITSAFDQEVDAIRLYREIHILRRLKGQSDCIIQLLDVIQPPSSCYKKKKQGTSSSSKVETSSSFSPKNKTETDKNDNHCYEDSSSSHNDSKRRKKRKKEDMDDNHGDVDNGDQMMTAQKKESAANYGTGDHNLISTKKKNTKVVVDDNDDALQFRDLYLVFEYVDTDLYKLIMSPQYLTTEHIQTFLYQMLTGIKYIHSSSVIHRDLKPANILLNEDCSLKICDFGLARIVNSATMCSSANNDEAASNGVDADPSSTSSLKSSNGTDSSAVTSKPGLTRQLTKHVVTRWYRAPELILIQPYTSAVDIWSLGCILAELLSMQEGSVPGYQDRVPLFPGGSCYPLSGEGASVKTDERLDQLSVIFSVIGTPSAEDVESIGKANEYINTLEKKPGRSLEDMYPAADPSAIDLLKKMLKFNPRKRCTAEEALEHDFLRSVRRKEMEVRFCRINDISKSLVCIL